MSKNRIILFSAIILYAVYAIFNSGFYYYDEHFQLIEFAELKSGNNLKSDLAWEYTYKIRSAIQPTMAYYFFSICRALNINSPYSLTILLRVVTSLGALSIITFFVDKTSFLVEDRFKTWYKLLAFFLWFLPFINVRFSSESYAGLTFILGVGIFYSHTKSKPYLMGALFGLSFLFRFQMAFLSAGFFAWLIFVHKADFKFIITVISAGLSMLIVGFLIDTWFYGAPVVTSYNYYVANVINNKAELWGVFPWYFYITETIQTMNAPMAVIIWGCILFQLILNKRSLVCWIIFPFLLAHFATPHKELRFIFPLANFIPLFIILTAQTVLNYEFFKRRRYGLIFVIAVIFIVNILSIVATALSPADSGGINLTRYIHENYRNRNLNLWVLGSDNPYKPIPEKQNFYLDKNVHWEQFNLPKLLQANPKALNLIVIRDDKLMLCQPFLQLFTVTELKSGIPTWIKLIRRFLGFRNKSLILFEIKYDEQAIEQN